MILKLMAFLGVLILVAPVTAEEPQVFKSEKEKMSYGIGVQVMRNFKQQGLEVDIALVIKGMRDALSGGKLLMTDEELRKTMISVQNELRLKQKQTRRMAVVDNNKEGDTFLAENKKKEGVVALPSGLQYKILKAGDGGRPTDADTVECHYQGTLINGSVFDSSDLGGQPAILEVKGLIPGWREALKLMPVGSKWQLFIPPQLAYGDRGEGGIIGPNSTLIFEVELLAIK
jgi:UDP-GlcNAc:undecaprenyl-phosphate/decaprenyl-phosphate GlcNAc-1-phosphate transferase